jgi:hypothetical protein
MLDALSSRGGSTVVEEEANEENPVPVERPRRRQSVSFTTEKEPTRTSRIQFQLRDHKDVEMYLKEKIPIPY